MVIFALSVFLFLVSLSVRGKKMKIEQFFMCFYKSMCCTALMRQLQLDSIQCLTPTRTKVLLIHVFAENMKMTFSSNFCSSRYLHRPIFSISLSNLLLVE